MPSSYSTLGFVLQATGENETAWGDELNDAALILIDESIRGYVAFTLSGTKVLSSTNGVSTDARKAILHATSGTGGTINIPGYSKIYLLINETSGDVEVTSGGATTATVPSTEASFVYCDGMGSVSVVGVNGQTYKQYADQLAFDANAGILPGQGPGITGYLKTTEGVNAWGAVSATEVSGLPQATTALIIALG